MATLAKRNQGWLPLFFNDFFKDDWKTETSSTLPAINVKENEHAYIIEVAAAGMTKDDFNVRIDDENDLVITMEKKEESKDENKDARYLRREFSYSKFQQTMILPDNVNKEKIEAKVEHGVLAVNLPKFTETEIQKKQRSITVG
ncbi:MAG: Hsp20/alpha crystallin family protein [Tannerella sp.]|jgi:HSP20 family protein|nr:Hsp20/alpha crystallin family protein [Tannerella sp.]